MNWYKNLFGFKNIDKNLPPKADARKFVKFENNVRIRAEQTIQKFRIAQRAWENPLNPNRTLMYDIYRDVILDAQVYSQLENRKVQTIGSKFRIVDNEGEENKELTKLFKTKWFHNFLNNSVETFFYGFTLHQLGPIYEDKIRWTDIVDRYNVKPEPNFQIVVATPGEMNGVDYTKAPISNWTIPYGDYRNKGILEKVALIQLYKRWALGTWAEFMELYGQPVRIGKTQTADYESKQNMIDMLANMGTNAWGVFNLDDEIEFIDSMKSSTGDSIHEHLIKYCDEQISKIIVGQTMTSDNGSSRSQAQVHEEVAESIFRNDQKDIEYMVNDELIPRLIRLGAGGIYSQLKGYEFEFFKEDKISLLERSQIDKNITDMGKTLTDEYITNRYNVELQNTPIDIKNTYKNVL